ncbi:transglutaminase domain-containing protein [Natronomonas halophila]|uniref:transglutaminase domain-containing protein n=1 Tax=Natronomonas halophila TaxID=2747817 RepID=UPI0015B52FC2|nr:transglutaminase domain-containing protein [Natronomonas halophila]QLD85531.1 transglutaminase domain-containing protein [Natronomonas halophila]
MRLASLVVVGLCVAALALAAPQIATDEPPLSATFGEDDDEAAPDYGPIEGSYFRVASYDRYTGQGWERTSGPSTTDALGPPPGESDRVTIRYEVQAPVRTTPALWRPTAYEGPEVAVFAGAPEPVAELQPGDQFTVTSRRPVWTEGDLRNAGTDYPAEVQRYRQLPDDTPAELDTVASEATADAETPYAKAVAVNRWLQQEKNYSLSVDRPRSDVATAFATEMDAGYCTYFATTMAAMLRAEGVPARYVTGYSPYEQVGAGEHVIRGKHAHTWVEVYFPGVGWIPFDPTPETERAAARGVATAEDAADEESALRGRFSTLTQEGEESSGWRQLDVAIEVDGSLVPGTETTVIVRDPETGDPISDAQVRFNGNPVGRTDAEGMVTATVPYAENLTVAAYVYEGEGDPPPVVGSDPSAGTATGGSNSIQDLRYAGPDARLSGSITALSDEVLFRATVTEGTVVRRGDPVEDGAVGTPEDDATPVAASLIGEHPRASTTATLGSERTFALNTTIDVALTPGREENGTVRFDERFDVLPGRPLRVEATIEGEPVADATVLAGQSEATTNAEGVAVVPTPYERPAEIRVERGAASGNVSISVQGRLDATFEGEPAPGASWRVTATVEGAPVENATVTNGVERATTDADGRARIPAPYGPGRFTVQRGDFEASRPIRPRVDEASIDLSEPVPGLSVRLRASVGDYPLRAATVSIDGGVVTETDALGGARIRLPYAETTTVVVERGEARAELTPVLPTDIAVETRGLAYPGGTVDVRATLGGAPVANATILAGGEAVGTTDANGEATVGVPPRAGSLTIAVERGAASGSAHAGYPAVYWLLALIVCGTAVAVFGTRGSVRAVARNPRHLLAAAGDALETLAADFADLLATRDAGTSPTPRPDEAAEVTGPFLVEPADDNDVYQAWAALADGLDGTQRTPAAVAEEALEHGLPADAVAELTTLFREVRYGDGDPTEERERRAREAIEDIREAT